MEYKEILFLVGRALLAFYFLRAGFNHFKHLSMMSGYAGSKGIPSPKAAVAGSGLLLLAGGLSFLTGRFVEWGVLCLVLFLVPVTIMMHAYWKVTDPMAKMGESVNFWKNIAVLGSVLMLLAIPQPWQYML